MDLFAANGYDGTSVQQIVERAGVTKGALYHYFTAKEDILLEIYTTVFDEQMAALDDIVAMERDPEWTLASHHRQPDRRHRCEREDLGGVQPGSDSDGSDPVGGVAGSLAWLPGIGARGDPARSVRR